jgi:hypothetical protein
MIVNIVFEKKRKKRKEYSKEKNIKMSERGRKTEG